MFTWGAICGSLPTMRADLYARKSTSDQGRSVARQERAWRTDCAMFGVEPGRVFVDPDFSASRYARRDRPDYAALLEQVRASACEMVSLWEVTRGSRQMGEWVTFLDLCRDQGVLIRVFGEDEPQTYDPRRQRDREYLLKEGMQAEAEVERLRHRIMPGIADAASQGRPPGPLLYGYTRVYGALTESSISASGSKRREIVQVVNDAEAAIVRQAARDTLAGIPLHTQARRLNLKGVPTPSGKGSWRGSNLNRMLRNPGYEGHRVHNGQVVAENAWPAILDPDTAGQLRALLETPGRRNFTDTSLKYDLSGAALCGECRKPMRVTRMRYQCMIAGCMKVSASSALMNGAVRRMVIARLQMPDAAVAFTPAQPDAQVAAVKEELRRLTDRQKELYAEAAKPGGPSMGLVAAAERELLPQIDAAQTRLRALQTPPALRGYDPIDLAQRWESYTVGEHRAVIMALAEIVLSPVGKGRKWSMWRLAESRWHGDDRTWGEIWRGVGGHVSS